MNYIKEYNRFVKNFLKSYSIKAQVADVDDIVQSSLCRALEGGVQPEEKVLYGYLMTSCTAFRCRALPNRGKHRDISTVPEEQWSYLPSDGLVDDLMPFILGEITRLTPAMQDAITLEYMGMSVTQAAKVHNCTVANEHVKRFRAKKTLSQIFSHLWGK